MKKLFDNDSVILSKTTGEPVEGIDIIYARESIDRGEYILGEDDILVPMSELSDELKSKYLSEINKEEIKAKGILLGATPTQGKFVGIIGEDKHFDKSIMSTSFNIPMPNDLGKAVSLDPSGEYYSMESLPQKDKRVARLEKEGISCYAPTAEERESKYKLMIILEESFIPEIENLLETGKTTYIKDEKNILTMSQEKDLFIISENNVCIFSGELHEYIDGTLSVDFLESVDFDLSALERIGIEILSEKYKLVNISSALSDQNSIDDSPKNTRKN